MRVAAGFLVALLAATGTYLGYTAMVLGWTGLGIAPPVVPPPSRGVSHQVASAPTDRGRRVEVVVASTVLAALGGAMAWALFAGVVAPVAAAVAAGWLPLGSARTRRQRRRSQGAEAWPRMLEELRLLTTAVGRSIPQALFEVGARGPEPLRPAFAEAQREWLLSTDFARALAVLKAGLDDATADAVCETLLLAHEIGGSDVDRRLGALVEDRLMDLHSRKDAASRQAGARFARAFVLVVPVGMALVGLTIGDGRAAYASAPGQAAVGVGIAVIAGCWLWAGRLLRLPRGQRVFST